MVHNRSFPVEFELAAGGGHFLQAGLAAAAALVLTAGFLMFWVDWKTWF
jgi:hypothetical protein